MNNIHYTRINKKSLSKTTAATVAIQLVTKTIHLGKVVHCQVYVHLFARIATLVRALQQCYEISTFFLSCTGQRSAAKLKTLLNILKQLSSNNCLLKN